MLKKIRYALAFCALAVAVLLLVLAGAPQSQAQSQSCPAAPSSKNQYQIRPFIGFEAGFPQQGPTHYNFYQDLKNMDYSFIINQPRWYLWTQDNIDKLHRHAPNTRILRYRSANEIFKSPENAFPEETDQYNADQLMWVQNTPAEWSEISTNYPNWFLKNVDGQRIHRREDNWGWATNGGENALLMDMENLEYQNWLVDQWMRPVLTGERQDYFAPNGLQTSAEFDGIYLDLLWPHFIHSVWSSTPVDRQGNKLTDADWRSKEISLTNHLREQMDADAQLTDKTILYNGIGAEGRYKQLGDAALDYFTQNRLDGFQIERFLSVTDQSGKYVGPNNQPLDDWLSALTMIKETTTTVPGKTLLVSSRNNRIGVDSEGNIVRNPANDQKHHEYALFTYATVLLGYNPAAKDNLSFLYSGRGWPCRGGLGEPHWLSYVAPQKIILGAPLNEYQVNTSSGIYYRHFQKGRVFVNPSPENSAEVLVKAPGWLDPLRGVNYRPGEYLQLPPQSASIVRNCSPSDLNCDGATNLLDLLHWRKAQVTGESATQPTGILGYLSILRGWLG